ncbi:MAG: dienelactone hydrolase family protein [Spirochaetaceae bacterium]
MKEPHTAHRENVEVPAGDVELPADLRVPKHAQGLVIFVHGSGSSRHSPRNCSISDRLVEGGYGSLLCDLLTEEEDRSYAARFDIERITARLLSVIRWAMQYAPSKGLRIGLFGSHTGAAGALRAVAELTSEDAGYLVRCVVSRDGRPDLSMEHLNRVTAPTLFIVGENDAEVLKLNEDARVRLGGVSALEVVPGAGPRFEEPGALDRVADLTLAWLADHL